MDREVINVTPGFAQHSPVPVHVVVTYRDQLDRRIDSTHRLRIPVVVTRVGFSIRVATHPVAPDLISNFPKFDAEWSRVTIGCTYRSMNRSCRSVAVLNPGCCFRRGGAASFDIDGN